MLCGATNWSQDCMFQVFWYPIHAIIAHAIGTREIPFENISHISSPVMAAKNPKIERKTMLIATTFMNVFSFIL